MTLSVRLVEAEMKNFEIVIIKVPRSLLVTLQLKEYWNYIFGQKEVHL